MITAYSIPSLEVYGTPVLVQVFLLVNIFQLFAAVAMIIEVKKVSVSGVWDNILRGNSFALLHTVIIAILLGKLYYKLSLYVVFLIALFYSIAVSMDILTQYLLAKPLIKTRINIARTEYLLLYAVSLISSWFLLVRYVPEISLPGFQNYIFLLVFAFFFLAVNTYVAYTMLHISKSYAKIGFIHKAFMAGGVGLFSLVLFGALTIYSELNYLYHDYYYLLLWLISVTFAVIYYMQFVIEYPSLLEPKWKALMPFDLAKVGITLTLVFLATSIYFTVKEYPTFTIYQNVPYGLLSAVLFFIFAAIAPVLAYTKAIAGRTKIRYWGYLKGGLFVHMAATLYVFALIALLWNGLEGHGKLLSALFVLSAFAFYLFYALDMRTITMDLGIDFSFDRLDIVRYFVSLYAFFFLVLFSISFTYQKTFDVLGSASLESYPFLLFFVAVFLIAFATYFSVTRKGFEELMKKNVWSELSYLFSFAAFVLVYLIYTSLKTEVQSFPLRELFFVSYFAVLMIEIYSIRTLEIREPKEEKKDIVDILNFNARYFLRTDYLEEAWEEIIDRYATLENNLESARFSPHSRKFYLQDVDERTRILASVAMLFDMHRMSAELDKVALAGAYSYDAMKRDIEGVLGEKILMLPFDLRGNFDEERYYPLLYEKVINTLIEEVKAFIPAAEHKTIFNKLARVNPFFKSIVFEDGTVKVPEDTAFSREHFIDNFKLYLSTLGDSFPFEHTLLYKPVRDLAKEELALYNFSLADLLDLVPTGFDKIDEITGGGLVKRTSTFLITEETDAKNEILHSFVGQGIKDDDNIVYATSKRPSKEVRNAILRDFGKMKNTAIIDFYHGMHTSTAFSEIIEYGDRTIIPTNTTLFQHSIVKAIKKYPMDAHKRVVLDVYNDLLKYYRWEELFPIMVRQEEGFRKWNCTSIVTLDASLISEGELEEAKKRFDTVIILSGKGREVSMVVSKLYGGTPVYKVISLYE